jgi:hypothetical protein
MPQYGNKITYKTIWLVEAPDFSQQSYICPSLYWEETQSKKQVKKFKRRRRQRLKILNNAADSA